MYLVRHAQASFLSANYDQLSDHGRGQARALGRAWLARGLRLDRVLSGPRVRQRDTAEEVAGVYAEGSQPVGAAEVVVEFDEYPAEEVLAGFAAEMQRRPEFAQLFVDAQQVEDQRARGRAFDRLLQHALTEWAGGRTPEGVISHGEFESRVASAFENLLKAENSGRSLAIFSSAGTIGAVAGRVLGTDARRRLELGWALNNASVTEIAFSGSRVGVMRFNDVGHLEPTAWTRR